ncbi:MAG: hypothetical protein ABS69_21790 [Nitrosomonadales bacterium SCN 54-20]|nr:MAG: hypothetical protein ABS69_21790 [Nitrosomonadales bacterium SCN 54-20]
MVLFFIAMAEPALPGMDYLLSLTDGSSSIFRHQRECQKAASPLSPWSFLLGISAGNLIRPCESGHTIQSCAQLLHKGNIYIVGTSGKRSVDLCAECLRLFSVTLEILDKRFVRLRQ